VIDANSGLRLGELVALRWPNVDLEKGIVKVREAVSWIKDGDGWILETHKPKSRKGVRDVPIPSEAVKAFNKISARQAAEKLKAGETYQNKKEYVFTREEGSVIDPFHLSKRFAKLAKRQGLDVNFHGLRHTYCSILISKGVDIKTVQNLLGNATTKMVLEVYAHVFPGAREEAVSKLEGIL
jgi:integrase